MKKWNLGVLGASDIAFRRILPAVEESTQFSFTGIAARNSLRCTPFIQRFGGRCFDDYLSLLNDPDIDCVYVPLPPGLHAYWGEKVLAAGKHLFMEKPFTTSYADTQKLLKIANEKKLAVHENYMFLYHQQFRAIKQIISEGKLGALHMIRASFTFPFRGREDFRYQPELGGGALFDCGGYPLLLVSELMGKSMYLRWAGQSIDSTFNVDIGGSAVLQNDSGLTAHIFYGMDDTYRCELELWGSQASLTASRIFTAPQDFTPSFYVEAGENSRTIQVPSDNQVLNSLRHFGELIENIDVRKENYNRILRQGELIEKIADYCKRIGERKVYG